MSQQHHTTNVQLLKMLGIDQASVCAVDIALRHNEPPRVTIDRLLDAQAMLHEVTPYHLVPIEPEPDAAPLPALPAPDLDDMADRAREALRATIEASARRHSHELHEAVLEYRQASLRVIGDHRRAVQKIMAHMWLQTEVRNLARTFGMQDFARGGVWSQSTGWLGIGGAAGTLTGQPDRRARPRGARP